MPRRGNLLVQTNEMIAAKTEVSAINMLYFEHCCCPALYQEIATGLTALAMTVVVFAWFR